MTDEVAEPKVNSWLKMGLEFGPIIAFFVAYNRLKDSVFTIGGTEYEGFILVTAGFVPLLALTTYLVYRLTGRLSPMQLITLLLVVVFGGLTIWLNDERFFKMKPTIIYLLFGGVLGYGLLRGTSYLKYAMDQAVSLTAEGWMLLTKRFCLFFFGLALVNEFVWRTMSTDAWVNFKTFGLPGAMFLFIMLHASLFDKYAAADSVSEHEDKSDTNTKI